MPFYSLVDRLFATRYVGEKLWQAGRELFTQAHPPSLAKVSLAPLPGRYGQPTIASSVASPEPAPIFITARFRSGSTFLWQLFRHIADITAYYEPFNEAKWFKKGKSNARVDVTHIGVDDYRTGYEGMEDLDRIFDTRWAFHGLYMDETHHNPNMERYIHELVKRAHGRAVLQFNRVDFRLPWLRAHFPQAKIIHLYRHPREQWMSIIGKGPRIHPAESVGPDQLSEPDGFYTLEWARDLRHVFPLLEPAGKHPYELHYMLWRLSYTFGRAYSDVSICYEELISDFEQVAAGMLDAVGVRNADIGLLASFNHGAQKVRWPGYADEAWFGALEARCERELQAFFSNISPMRTD
ncbi:MAG: sulfotransferase [Thiobacillus sp.]|uniref:sulfotransferase n=1 Tax=Thiobacillus sp. TaxID=924 RepID=UPI002895ECFD|nr:sulfotransferase [Thiobacillus sp.]MDT3706856.1 sulfotransferase [Thiobacillus sp.]